MTQTNITKRMLTIIILGIIAITYSCESPKDEVNTEKSIEIEVNEDTAIDTATPPIEEASSEEKVPVDTSPKAFVKCLKNGADLVDFFAEKWTLIYYKDDRSDGATNGELKNLDPNQIDNTIKLKVRNDGDGWANESDEPRIVTNYVLDFNLKELVSDWDRFKIVKNQSTGKGLVTIEGSGMQDFLEIYYTNEKIVKLVYQSIDPG